MTANIEAEELIIGEGTIIEPSVKIRGLNGKAKRIKIGDHCYIGENVQIICDDFEIGDYSKIQHDCNIHGYKPCKIGHNLWLGQFSIIDTIGGCEIGNNCGIGAHSQLWSHIKFGDTLEGCRFLSEGKLEIGNDVWFVGHCIVSPIKAEDKSMALVGSVITKDMKQNTIYSGMPAKSLSEKIGPQFEEKTLEEKYDKLLKYLIASGVDQTKVQVIKTKEGIKKENVSYFVVKDRSYTKIGSPDEVKFMKFLLPEKAKFIPY